MFLQREEGKRRCSPFVLSPAQLQLGSVLAAWLIELHTVTSGDAELISALSWYRHMRCLSIAFSSVLSTEACIRLMDAISTLNPATMHTLSITFACHSQLAPLSFAPLSALTELRKFAFLFQSRGRSEMIGDTQINELRNLSSRHRLQSPYATSGPFAEAKFFTRLLQPGHAIQWTKLGTACDPDRLPITEPLATVLGSLPTLRMLSAKLRCGDVRFFTQLPQLITLDLSGPGVTANLAELVESLRHCSQLTSLSLTDFGFTAQHVSALLPAVPQLHDVSLVNLPLLGSLCCFATPALASSLQVMWLGSLPACPSSEVCHLLSLRSLRRLHVRGLLGPGHSEMDSAFRDSRRFPILVSYEWK